MSYGQDYWGDWIGYWGYVSAAAMDRWQHAATRLRKEDYKIESMLSDVVGFWMDTTNASIAAWRGSMRTPQTLIFCLDQDDEVACPKCVPILDWQLPNRPPSFVWLKCLDTPEPPPEHRIDWDNLFVRLSADKTQLEVKLHHMRRPLAPATYRAVVHVDEVPIAEVLIVVRQSRKAKAGGNAAQPEPAKKK